MATRAASERSSTSTSSDARDDTLDEALVRQILRGSQEALGALYDRHAAAIYAGAMRTSGDAWVATEVVQETFLALWNQAERFDPARGGLRAWLQTIARNRAIDRRRSALRHDRAATFSSFGHEDSGAFAEWFATAGQLIGSASPEPGPEAAMERRDTLEALGDAVAGLSPDEQTAIRLAYQDGLSQSEIATALAWPIGTVKTRTRRALQHLREALARTDVDRWGGEPRIRASMPSERSGSIQSNRCALAAGCVADA